MQAVLVMFRSDGDRRSFSLTRDITVVGRREDCDLRIPLSEVSRKHCRLVRDGDSLRLEDLGSSNGTYHNAQRVQEAILSPGDSIQVGPLVFVLQVDGVPADEELAPVEARSSDENSEGGMDEDGPLQPTAQSDDGMRELPTIDNRGHMAEHLEEGSPLEEYEPLEEVPAEEGLEPLETIDEMEPEEGLDLISEEGMPSLDQDIDLGEEPLHFDEEENSKHH